MRNKFKIPKMLQNSLTGMIASALSTVSIYSIRIVISHVLGEEIYGINSIFISIVSTLLILELGMSTAVIILLYRPVSDNDKEKIKSIINFFRIFYRFFCLFIVFAGSVTALFFLKFFVNTSISLIIVQGYFMLYVFSVALKYLWSYKSCLLYANKKNSVISIVTIINTIVFTFIEVLCIIITNNYWIYLILYLVQNISQNAFCNIYANKHFEYIKEKKVKKLTKSEKNEIIAIVRPMFVQRIANQIQDSSSVIILGAVGASAVSVGFFSNYIFVVHACQTLFNQVGASFTTSYGNFSAKTENIEKKLGYYLASRFYMSWVATIFSTAYLCLIQDFISLFFGNAYVLSHSIAFVLASYVFVVLDSSINLSTQNAVGAHYLDTKEIIIQAILGVVISTILGKVLGPFGITLGMLISVGIFTGIVKGTKVLKHIYQCSELEHIKLMSKELVVFYIVSGVCYSIYCKLLKPVNILGFVISALIIFVVSNFMFLAINAKSMYLEHIKKIVKIAIK